MIPENPLKFTATELFESAFDHDKAAKNGLAAGPNVSYVRTFQRCAWAMRIVAGMMKNRWRHLKRGSEYYEIGRAELQLSLAANLEGQNVSEGDILVVYAGEGGKLWARLENEFEDGRFERIK